MTDDVAEGGDDRVSLPPGTPDPAAWAELPDDLFARVVPHVRRGLADLDELEVTSSVQRLRAVPATKLGRGRARRRLLDVLAGGGPLWVAVRRRVGADEALVADLAAALASTDGVGAPDQPDADGTVVRLVAAEQARDQARAQRDRAREERDEARRQRDGLRGREASMKANMARLQDQVASLGRQVARLEQDLATAAEDRRNAVAREERRGEADRAGLAAELADARREVDQLRRERARRESPDPDRTAGRPIPATPVARGRARPGRSATAGPPDRVVPGRPSRLPAGLRLDTRDGAARLLAAVPRLLVDGYNVTRTHRRDLDLAAQRDWLVNGLAAMVARRGLEVTVVFDAHQADKASGSARRGVRVQYSHPGVTADDEIVLAVEALERDVAVVVVTDDRDLRNRLARARVDLLHTAPFTGLLG